MEMYKREIAIEKLLSAAKYAISALAVHNAGGSIESDKNLITAQKQLFDSIVAIDPSYYGYKQK